MSTKRSVDVIVRAHDKASNKFNKIGKSMGGISAGLGKLKTLIGAYVGYRTIKGFANFTSSMIDYMDQSAKFSDVIGIQTDELQRFRYAAEISGTSIEKLDKALMIMVRRVGEAVGGQGEGIRGIQMLGKSADEFARMNPAKMFEEVAEAIKKQKTPAEQAALAYFMFGRQGVELLNLLKLGKEELKKLGKEADSTGNVFTRSMAAKAEEAKDAMTRLQWTMRGLGQTLVMEIIPYIELASLKLAKMAEDANKAGPAIDVMSVGWRVIKTPLKALSAFGKGLALFGLGAAELVTFGNDTIQDLQKTYAESFVGSFTEIYDMWAQGLPSTQAGILIDKMRDAGATKAQATAMVEQAVALASAIDKTVAALKTQIATYEMSSREAAIYKLRMAGATEATLGNAIALSMHLDTMDAEKKAMEEMAKAMERFESAALSLEKELSLLNGTATELQWKQFDWAMAGMNEDQIGYLTQLYGKIAEANKSKRSEDILKSRGGVGAIESRFLSRAPGIDTAKNTELNTKQLVKQGQKEERDRRELIDAVKSSGSSSALEPANL